VEATCDRVAFVKRGRVVHELVLAEMQSGLDVEIRVGGAGAALVEGLREFGSGASLEGDVVRLHVEQESSLPAIARWLAGRNAELYELKVRRKTLEEWFVEVMGDDQGPG
jgi:ABC-2 type transport system ATP-binding protein